MTIAVLTEYWWLVALAAAVAIIPAFLLLRPRQNVRLSDEGSIRPHMAAPPAKRGLAGEAAAAAGEVAGAIADAPARGKGTSGSGDDLLLLKGVGPKLAQTLRGFGFDRFEQIATLSPNEIERLDHELGSFRGRLTRDRIVEQAEYLARRDFDGFEQRFGKL